MAYDTPEERYNLKHPLISLNSGRQNDFVKALYFKLALKGAKKIIYYLKLEIERLTKREKNQTAEIGRLLNVNKELRKEIESLENAFKNNKQNG